MTVNNTLVMKKGFPVFLNNLSDHKCCRLLNNLKDSALFQGVNNEKTGVSL